MSVIKHAFCTMSPLLSKCFFVTLILISHKHVFLHTSCLLLHLAVQLLDRIASATDLLNILVVHRLCINASSTTHLCGSNLSGSGQTCGSWWRT